MGNCLLSAPVLPLGMGGLRHQYAPCSNSVCYSWMLDVWGFSMPQAPWAGHHSRLTWLCSKARSASRCGWGKTDAKPGGTRKSYRECHRCVKGAKLGGKLQLPGLTCSWCTLGYTHTHTSTPHPTQKGRLIHPEHHQSFCNPHCHGPGQAVAL